MRFGGCGRGRRFGAAVAVCAAVLGAAASAPVAAAGAPAAVAPRTDVPVAEAAPPGLRDRLMQDGEAALRRGDSAAALQAFEGAAQMRHAADAELALVHARLQAGDYAQALAFCGHTAGAHRESAAPAALYAWLLQAGGQAAQARRVLDEAGARLPGGDALLAAVGRELASPWPRAAGALLERPHRLAPESLPPVDDAGAGAALSPTARVVASGVLLADGRRALVPLEALAGAERAWVRNGLGRTVAVRVERALDREGVAVVALAAPLPLPPAFSLAPRDAYAGSVVYTVAYAAAPTVAAGAGAPDAGSASETGAPPAWPWLHAGFAGSVAAATGRQRLGIAVPAGPRGGPVFDAAGRLAGMAVADAGGDRLMPASALRAALPDAAPASAEPAAGRPTAEPIGVAALPLDRVYERALRVALQVVVAP